MECFKSQHSVSWELQEIIFCKFNKQTVLLFII